MPLFDFECRSCGKRFERLVRATDRDDAIDCPACGKTDAQRLLSAPAPIASDSGVRFTGGGGGGCGRSGFT